MHEEGILNNGESAGYAFALRIGTYRGLRTVSHGGSLAGYRAQLMRFPEQHFSVILLANRASFKATAMAQKVAEIYLEESMDPHIEEVALEEEVQPEEEKEISIIALNEYTGTYYSEELEVNYMVFEDKANHYYSIR